MQEFAIIHEHGQVPDTLRAVPFFGSFNDEQLDDLLNSSSYLECEEGDVIIHEGAIDTRIYILLSGAVEVRKGDKSVATITRAGEVFGELAVVNEDRRSATVAAAKPTVCLAVDQKFLQDMKPRDEDPGFYAALYEFIARITAARLHATSRRLAQVELELRELKESLVPKPKKTKADPEKGKAKETAVKNAARRAKGAAPSKRVAVATPRASKKKR